MACDQRRASRIAVWSCRLRPMNSAISTMVGSAMPRQARMMWNPSVAAICARAGTTCPLPGAAASRAIPLARIGLTGPGRPGLAAGGVLDFEVLDDGLTALRAVVGDAAPRSR